MEFSPLLLSCDGDADLEAKGSCSARLLWRESIVECEMLHMQMRLVEIGHDPWNRDPDRQSPGRGACVPLTVRCLITLTRGCALRGPGHASHQSRTM